MVPPAPCPCHLVPDRRRAARLVAVQNHRPHGPAQIRQFLADVIILDPAPAVMRIYAQIMRRRVDLHQPENVKDAWIGATDLGNRLPLVTYDRTGFLDIGLLGLDLHVMDLE